LKSVSKSHLMNNIPPFTQSIHSHCDATAFFSR